MAAICHLGLGEAPSRVEELPGPVARPQGDTVPQLDAVVVEETGFVYPKPAYLNGARCFDDSDLPEAAVIPNWTVMKGTAHERDDYDSSESTNAGSSSSVPTYAKIQSELSHGANTLSISAGKPEVHRTASAEDIESLTKAHQLSEARGSQLWQNMRYVYLSCYRRLWALVILANIGALAVIIARLSINPGSFSYNDAATATAVNLATAALARHEHLVNLIFRLAVSLPRSSPLWIRAHVAKVYCYGGVHSGCGVSAVAWFIFFSVLVARQFEGSYGATMALRATVATTLLLLLLMTILAHPLIRRKWHNQWELSHRYSAWVAIGLVWAQTLLTTTSEAHRAHTSILKTLFTTPTIYLLTIITLCLIYPWLRLRRRAIVPEPLSNHATRLHFPGKPVATCVGYKISHNPLTENHAFATIPAVEGQTGFSMVVSNAGDWTSTLIKNPPSHIWTRGAPTIGVMRVATLFSPLVVIATGSGIGPCLSFLQVYPDYPVRIIWSAARPAATYGHEIMNAVFKADRRALVIDTKVTGRPNLSALAWAIREESGAEAVVIISNPKVTGEVVFEMERRGVPAFGAIFDS